MHLKRGQELPEGTCNIFKRDPKTSQREQNIIPKKIRIFRRKVSRNCLHTKLSKYPGKSRFMDFLSFRKDDQVIVTSGNLGIAEPHNISKNFIAR